MPRSRRTGLLRCTATAVPTANAAAVPATIDTIALNDEIRTLYREHGGWLRGWLHRRIGCPHHAADLLHDTYLRVLVSGRTPPTGQARPHLMQIAKGLVVDRHRRQRVERAYAEVLAMRPEVQAPSPEDRLLVLEALVRIDAMLDRLRPRARETFLLSQLDGLTYRSIAARLGVSVATVRNDMRQGMQACLDALGDAPGDGSGDASAVVPAGPA